MSSILRSSLVLIAVSGFSLPSLAEDAHQAIKRYQDKAVDEQGLEGGDAAHYAAAYRIYQQVSSEAEKARAEMSELDRRLTANFTKETELNQTLKKLRQEYEAKQAEFDQAAKRIEGYRQKIQKLREDTRGMATFDPRYRENTLEAEAIGSKLRDAELNLASARPTVYGNLKRAKEARREIRKLQGSNRALDQEVDELRRTLWLQEERVMIMEVKAPEAHTPQAIRAKRAATSKLLKDLADGQLKLETKLRTSDGTITRSLDFNDLLISDLDELKDGLQVADADVKIMKMESKTLLDRSLLGNYVRGAIAKFAERICEAQSACLAKNTDKLDALIEETLGAPTKCQ